jgi:N-acetylneuraminate synthase
MNKPSIEIQIQGRKISLQHPTYFIADIAANHDGDLEKAKDLIYLCKEAGADAAKFQHFKAKSIVSDYGFKNLPKNNSHQASWKKSIFDVYQDASLNPDWTPILKETCDKAGITFFTSPYSFDLVDLVDSFVPAYKVGSGDITWTHIIQHMCSKGKPMLLACGASEQKEVDIAVATILANTSDIVLMQCNTNYSASLENFKYVNLNVIQTFKNKYPNMILGLSDHTPGHATVLGAVAFGARVIEKHFTDNNERSGPDHKFAMNPQSWKEMMSRSRELEAALGDGVKVVEENEKETVVLQRRSIRVTKDLPAGAILQDTDLEVLRPAPRDSICPYEISEIIGKKVNRAIAHGDYLRRSDLGTI